MTVIDNVLLYIGLFVLIPSSIYLTTCSVIDMKVQYQRIKTKKSIATDIVGVRENRYHVPKSLLKQQAKLNDNKVFAKLGLILGLFMILIPLYMRFFEYLKDTVPTWLS
ncbi:hypothetical protein [Staphylococcus argenteus]|uniref:hypothetical protein n=1 Tax=Staphylococcus argenteus TaxID=985002 RepID=UPI000F84083B|nr:hypothetical protein [Staphylococcus argenteus]